MTGFPAKERSQHYLALLQHHLDRMSHQILRQV
jgi:hypothetical protein